jgi:adenylate cyclase
MRNRWKNFVAWVEDSVTLPEDSESLRIRKMTITIAYLVIIPITFIWTLALFYLQLWAAGWINLAFNLHTLVSGVYLFRTRNFIVFFNVGLGILFLYIYGLQTSLGGIINSGVIMGAGLIAAMSAALILSRRTSIFWAGVNVVGFTLVLAFEEQIAANAPIALPAAYSLVNGFFNALWYSFLAMFLILYLVRELESAQDLADQLLYNVLPKPIAARLKKNPGTIADGFENASALFADIVGFTPLSNQLSPIEMIELLNRIYSHFDTLVEKYGVEKIRTIGDNYMVASGVPTPRLDHAQALAHLALDMLAYCGQLEKEGRPLKFRIGINSGPLTAGIIGNKKFQYDIYGDTVNTASRMESHGVPGKIQISKDTYEILKDEFALEHRGTIDVKGKGQMETWFLTSCNERTGP